MNIGKFYCGLLLILAISCEVVKESHTPKKRSKSLSLSERANQSYYQSVAKARRLQQVLKRRRKGINDPADMYFMFNNKLFKYTWWHGRFVRMPDLMNPGLSNMLNQLAKSHKTPLNKQYKKNTFVPLVPLYPRFAPKKNNLRQMQCSLNVSFIPMRHYLKIGVLVVVAEFTSSCRTDIYRKYFWIHTWDPASYFVLRIDAKSFVFSWMKPERAHDRKMLFMEYETVKMLNEFKGNIYSLDERIKRMINAGKMYAKLKKVPKPLNKKVPVKQVKTKSRRSVRKSSRVSVVGKSMPERNLSDRIYDDQPLRHYQPRHHRRSRRGYSNYRRSSRRLMASHRSRNLRHDNKPINEITSRPQSRHSRRSRRLNHTGWFSHFNRHQQANHHGNRPQSSNFWSNSHQNHQRNRNGNPQHSNHSQNSQYSQSGQNAHRSNSNRFGSQSNIHHSGHRSNSGQSGQNSGWFKGFGSRLNGPPSENDPFFDERDRYRRRIRPDELPHPDPNHPLNENYIEDNEENPHNQNDKFVDPQSTEEYQYDAKQHPWSWYSRHRLKTRDIKARNHFHKRSFQTLEARNPALTVKIIHIKDPYDFFPNVQAKDPNATVFFLAANEKTRPFWSLSVINRIWGGVNPQICNAKYVRNIRNSHINCVL